MEFLYFQKLKKRNGSKTFFFPATVFPFWHYRLRFWLKPGNWTQMIANPSLRHYQSKNQRISGELLLNSSHLFDWELHLCGIQEGPACCVAIHVHPVYCSNWFFCPLDIVDPWSLRLGHPWPTWTRKFLHLDIKKKKSKNSITVSLGLGFKTPSRKKDPQISFFLSWHISYLFLQAF